MDPFTFASQTDHFIQVEAFRVVERAAEAIRNLSVPKASRFAQLALDLRANRAPGAGKMPRDSRFVFFEQTSDPCERQVLSIVPTETKPIARLQSRHRASEGALDQIEIVRPV